MSQLFIKMHGLGNDFVIFDGRKTPIAFTREQLRLIADRRFGVGCDQVIVIEPSSEAEAFMRIYNPDGGEIDSCGNATRCVAWILMEETGKDRAVLKTNAERLVCERVDGQRIRADMGQPRFEWSQIPLSQPCDTLHLDIKVGDLSRPVAVGMGNPHMVFVVPSADDIAVAALGPKLEHHPLFPERANISFAQAVSHDSIKLRVWERGAGETLACGTAACAALVALHRRGLVGTQANVWLPGGVLDVKWDMKSNHITMTGAVALVFSGKWYE
jgi:diaminopimelate epimerase